MSARTYGKGTIPAFTGLTGKTSVRMVRLTEFGALDNQRSRSYIEKNISKLKYNVWKGQKAKTLIFINFSIFTSACRYILK